MDSPNNTTLTVSPAPLITAITAGALLGIGYSCLYKNKNTGDDQTLVFKKSVTRYALSGAALAGGLYLLAPPTMRRYWLTANNELTITQNSTLTAVGAGGLLGFGSALVGKGKKKDKDETQPLLNLTVLRYTVGGASLITGAYLLSPAVLRQSWYGDSVVAAKAKSVLNDLKKKAAQEKLKQSRHW